MPNILPLLDESRSYIYCPTCQSQGNRTSELRRTVDKFRFQCTIGHMITYAELQRAGVDLKMIPLEVIEMPSTNSVAKQIHVHPETWEHLQHKFQGRFHVTIGTFLDLLANDSVIFIEGDDAKELKRRGIANGKQMLAYVEASQGIEKEREILMNQLKVLEPVVNALREQGIV